MFVAAALAARGHLGGHDPRTVLHQYQTGPGQIHNGGQGRFLCPSLVSLSHSGFLLSSVSKRGSRPVSPEVGQKRGKVDEAGRVLLRVALQQIRLQSWDVYIKV